MPRLCFLNPFGTDAYDELSQAYLLPRQPDGLVASLASKKEMVRLAREHDVPTPDVTFPESVDDVRAFAAFVISCCRPGAHAVRAGRTSVIRPLEASVLLSRLFRPQLRRAHRPPRRSPAA